MDEAERCHRVVYLSGGKLIVQGPAETVVENAHLAVFEATGGNLGTLVRRARATPGIESATVIGRALRVVGTNQQAAQTAVETLTEPGITWAKVPARLDDVFIHLLGEEAPHA
jgi:ABC-2 type transport system ATP-binding protein